MRDDDRRDRLKILASVIAAGVLHTRGDTAIAIAAASIDIAEEIDRQVDARIEASAPNPPAEAIA